MDVGDAIGGHEDYELIQYRYLLRAFAAMKYDALNIGHREAQLSAAQLRELRRPFPGADPERQPAGQSDRANRSSSRAELSCATAAAWRSSAWWTRAGWATTSGPA